MKFFQQIDYDVQSEINRIKSSNLYELSTEEPLIVNQLVKLFKNTKNYVAAVDNLSFGVKSHKCFGLLVNIKHDSEWYSKKWKKNFLKSNT